MQQNSLNELHPARGVGINQVPLWVYLRLVCSCVLGHTLAEPSTKSPHTTASGAAATLATLVFCARILGCVPLGPQPLATWSHSSHCLGCIVAELVSPSPAPLWMFSAHHIFTEQFPALHTPLFIWYNHSFGMSLSLLDKLVLLPAERVMKQSRCWARCWLAFWGAL